MKIRYNLTPQMNDYDRIGQLWAPYLMFFHKPNYVSNVLNTDDYGFRVTAYASPHKNNCLLVGGSYVFGVGATQDEKTLPSLLNKLTDYNWLNFGGRAFTSTQELLLFQFHHQKIPQIKKIVILSGINNLVLHYLSKRQGELGTFFFENQFHEQMNAKLSKKRWLAKTFFYPFFKDKIDYAHVSFKELINYIIKRESDYFTKHYSQSMLPELDTQTHILRILKRDIVNWTLFSRALGAELSYVLQPFANWIPKVKSTEEQALFAELDQLQGAFWQIINKTLDKDMHHWYVAALENLCTENSIHFFDLNAALSRRPMDKQWLFVDRVHTTDACNQLVAEILANELLL